MSNLVSEVQNKLNKYDIECIESNHLLISYIYRELIWVNWNEIQQVAWQWQIRYKGWSSRRFEQVETQGIFLILNLAI